MIKLEMLLHEDGFYYARTINDTDQVIHDWRKLNQNLAWAMSKAQSMLLYTADIYLTNPTKELPELE